MRNLTFFDGHAIGLSVSVLLGYVIFGLILFTIGKKSVAIADVKAN
ncbi:hypothetical protein LNP00_04260 [Fructobacillus sp. M158]|nr:hypothetical protein [Fructobacillus parabroussonetiae]MCK8617577.1 hypothetical protein [Fructobacillus parabroussonetiae]